MSLPIHFVRRLISRRRGSVLILVVALLLLMAIIGTAFISGARTDRYAAVQHNANTQADLLLQGVENLATSAISSALTGTTTATVTPTASYRQPSQEMPLPAPQATYTFNNFDASATDTFLAERTPVLPSNSPSSLMPVSWQSVSWPLIPNAAGDFIFDSPFERSGTEAAVNVYLAANKAVIQSYPATYSSPTGQQYPGLIHYVPSGSTFYTATGVSSVLASDLYLTPTGNYTAAPTAANYNSYVTFAGDADGDGIADAPMFKLPVGQIDGVTFYAGIRIVDNAAAINASTAWELANDPVASLTVGATTYTSSSNNMNFGFFRTNVGLLELLNPSATVTTAAEEMNALNDFRAYGYTYASPASAPAFAPTVTPKPWADGTTLSPTPTDRSGDYSFYSVGDAFESQLNRRGINPGILNYAPGATSKFYWLGNDSSASLASRFCLTRASASPSTLESILPNELMNYANAKSYPYSAGQIYSSSGAAGYWYNDLFSLRYSTTTPATVVPNQMRTMVVGSNAVLNASPSRYGNTASIQAYVPAQTYQFGDMVSYGGYRYVSLVGSNTGQTPPTPPAAPAAPIAESAYWGLLPWTSVPLKASANTATFSQLWLAYCHVMTDSVTTAAGSAPQWAPPMTTPAAAGEPQLPMFRSSVRDNSAIRGSGFVLTPMQEMQLRAAVAAVNTMDLRDGDDDVTSRHVTLCNTSGAPQFDLEVYGTEMQPYVSEALVDVEEQLQTSTKNSYVIELTNPYPKPILLTNWQFAYIARPSVPNSVVPIPAPSLTITAIGGLTATIAIPAASGNVPGRAYITGANTNQISGFTLPAPQSVGIGAATYSNTGVVTGLETAIGEELVILKPRLASGVFSPAAAAGSADSYSESAANVSELVPVDQLDTTNALTLAAGSRLHYRRGNDPTVTPSYAWNFVYPGPYASDQPVANNSGLRMAFQVSTGGYVAAEVGFGVPKSGTPTAAAGTTPTYYTAPLQLCNTNMAGPNPTVAAAGNEFPFGGFARNADLMQVPFVGAYRIRAFGAAIGSTSLTELNCVGMDSSYAFDTTLAAISVNPDTTIAESMPQAATAFPANVANETTPTIAAFGATFQEQIGRFCPVGDCGADAAAADVTRAYNAKQTLDFVEATVGGIAPATNWHYHWTKKLFDYLTVLAPHDDYMPNVDPAVGKYPGPAPLGVANRKAAIVNATSNGSEDTVGVEGLININTAPVWVLASLPFVPKGTHNLSFADPTSSTLLGAASIAAGSPDDTNTELARAIVAYRALYGPFKSIDDLYKVPAFALENQSLWDTTEPLPTDAYFIAARSSAGEPMNSPRFDFAERFLLLDHVSNLITTRSDSFTCYVLLQGWRNVGSSAAALVVQRRAALLLDRTSVTPINSQPNTFPVSQN